VGGAESDHHSIYLPAEDELATNCSWENTVADAGADLGQICRTVGFDRGIRFATMSVSVARRRCAAQLTMTWYDRNADSLSLCLLVAVPRLNDHGTVCDRCDHECVAATPAG
jgi:hypothetical protein